MVNDPFASFYKSQDVRADFAQFVASKGPNVLALDLDEFLQLLLKRYVKTTSVQRSFARALFENYANAARGELLALPLPPATEQHPQLAVRLEGIGEHVTKANGGS